MSQVTPTTTADLRLNPAPELTTVSQKTVPAVRQMVLAPEERTRMLPPAIARPGTLQKSDIANRATQARTQPAGAGVAQIMTQNWPGAKVTKPTAVTGCLKLYAGQAGAKTSQEPAGLTQHVQHYVTRKTTWAGTRKVQVEESPPPNPIIHTAVASPHKVAQGRRQKLMDPAPWMRFHPFVKPH